MEVLRLSRPVVRGVNRVRHRLPARPAPPSSCHTAMEAKMAVSVEARLRALEGSRLAMLGRMNAYQTMLVDAWLNIILKQSEDPIVTAKDIGETWLKAGDEPRDFPGVDPAHLDAVSQEYGEAMEDLIAQLLRAVQGAVSKGDNSQSPDQTS